MNKSELVAEVASDTEVSQINTKAVIDATLEAIAEQITAGNEVQLPGFGKFSRVDRAGRSGTNQFTGKKFSTESHHAPKFEPAKALKEQVW